MNRITDVTRQDLIDTIKGGVWIAYDTPQMDFFSDVFVDGYSIQMPIYGRLSEIEFLYRIYDLDNMPSNDFRYFNASGDIRQHTINNSDWDDYWYFSDNRFHLSNGNDDKYILRFICEMLHPAVRDEKSDWKAYLKRFNEILEPDGYQLVTTRKISGRDVFEAKELDRIEITHSFETIYAGMKSLGQGSYARVFKYTDEFYHKDFALKRAKHNLDEKELVRFKREFTEMQELNSPYIVEVYSFNEAKNEYIMECMDCTLEKYMANHNASMSVNTRKSIISQLLRAYHYLHSKNIYHRDISIKNVLIKQYDDVLIAKISDFGLVKIVDSDLTSLNTEMKGSLNDPSLKTEGFGNYGLIHEIYALTLLFAYIMTGKSNWAKITEPSIRAFIEKGTNPEKSKRFQSLDELGKAVNQCLAKMERYEF